ncbi:MAG: hypothetical protein CVU39_13085 [Chloroflexi bacterium HGW-Chloroflexi-10]|nr:MAG: hypothetical protein CVU39_13085 [Chloroflexi bacterium HGW-Chloroflexi-10]
MPLYEYICNDCGQPFEKMLRFSEADQVPVCPMCSGANTRKRISLFASSGTASNTASSAGSSCSSSPTSRFR